MRRRDFIQLIGCTATAWPISARAQQPSDRMRLIGVFEETAEDDKERNSQFAKLGLRLEYCFGDLARNK